MALPTDLIDAEVADAAEPETEAPAPDESGVAMIDPTNYAETPEGAADAKAFLDKLLPQARQDRTGMDTLNQQLYNIWDCTTDIRWYNGRADIYLPAGNQAIERNVSKQMARLFPSGDDCIDVLASPAGDDGDESAQEEIESAKALMLYDLTVSLRLKRQMPIALRQLNMLGTSPFASDYVTSDDLQAASRRGRRQFRLRNDPKRGIVPASTVNGEESGPRGRVCDLNTWYVSPATVDSLADAVVVWEDQVVTRQYLERLRRAKLISVTDKQLDDADGKFPEYSIWGSSERMKARGAMADHTDGLYCLTRAYAYYKPKDAPDVEEGQKVPNEDEDRDPEELPFQFLQLGDGTVVCARQNPWWHQSPPYDVARIYPYVGEFYGRGIIYFARKLQYQINDTARQTFDQMAYSLQPIAAVDPLHVPDPELLQYRPGAKWPVPPEAIKWHVIPATHMQGFQAVRQLWETFQESAGSTTGGQYMPTMGVARGAETATGMSLLVGQADISVAGIISGIEEEMMEPLCQRLDSMEQQFLPEEQPRLLRALGRKAIPLLQNGMSVRREQMLGTRSYIWTGGTVSEQREQFQKAGPQFLKILSEIKPGPEGKVKIMTFVKNLYRSFGFADADSVIVTPTAGEGFDPALEHLVMQAGHPISPKLGENYSAHLRVHDAIYPQAKAQGWSEHLKTHMAETVAMARDDQEFLAKMQAQMQPQGPPQPGGQPGAGPSGPPMPPGAQGPPMPPQAQPGQIPGMVAP